MSSRLNNRSNEPAAARWRVGPVLLAAFAALPLPLAPPALGCPFCARLGKSLADAVAEADLVIEGILEPARLDTGTRGTTPVRLLRVIKSPTPLTAGGVVTLARYVAASGGGRARRIIFGHVSEDRIDPYRVIAVADERQGEYLAGVVRAEAGSPPARLGYFFGYLEDPDPDIAEDAYKEFAKAPFRSVRAARAFYRPDRLLAWIADPATPPYRIGLYGLLVGCAGREGDEGRLNSWIDGEEERFRVGLDGLLAGAALLNPRGGTKRILDILSDASVPFSRRLAAASAVRFLLEEVPEIERAAITERLADALTIEDAADLLVDQLRRAEAFALTSRVMALADENGARPAPLERALVRFALAAGDREVAKAFLARIQVEHPTWIAEEIQNLAFEAEARRLAESAR